MQALTENTGTGQTYLYPSQKETMLSKDKLTSKQPNTLDKNPVSNKSTGLSFPDLIDTINPLHHLPIVGSIYREITGDRIDPIPRITGGSIFFGPIGFISAAVNVFFEELTGKDIQTHISSMLSFKSNKALNNQKTKERIDPVTAWAQKEVNFRRIQAKKDATQQMNKAVLKTPEEPIKLSFNQKNNQATTQEHVRAYLAYKSQIEQTQKSISEVQNKKLHISIV